MGDSAANPANPLGPQVTSRTIGRWNSSSCIPWCSAAARIQLTHFLRKKTSSSRMSRIESFRSWHVVWGRTKKKHNQFVVPHSYFQQSIQSSSRCTSRGQAFDFSSSTCCGGCFGGPMDWSKKICWNHRSIQKAICKHTKSYWKWP